MSVRVLARVFVGVLATTALLAGCASNNESSSDATATSSPPARARGATVATPVVSGPVTGGQYDLPFNPMPKRLADQYSYDEQEYFVDGTATAYSSVGDWGPDGKWQVAQSTTAPYTTRIIVRRPTDPARFNGTVMVEWLNVTVGMDADAEFGFADDQFLQDGYAYVGVSVQASGVVGGGPTLDIPGYDPLPLKDWDPERYVSLVHPGDDYSYDIFSQAAKVIRDPSGVNPLEGLDVQHVIALGESQSAGRMVTYVNAVQPVADIYDGFVIHSRGGTGAVLTAGSGRMPVGAHIRDDLSDPVMQIETETDLFGLGFFPARQADTDGLRTWELAGTAHADQATLDYGVESGRLWNTTTQLNFDSVCGLMNKGPQRFMIRAAVVALNAWVVDGTPPPTAAPMDVANNDIVRDQYGNAVGGIRTPAVDVPISTLSGEPDEGESAICSLFGSTVFFDAARLQQLYPTHQQYVDAVTSSADAAVAAGFVTPGGRDEMVATAEAAPIPS